MTIQPAMLDSLLADAVGDDGEAVRRLRALFLASATAHVATMSSATELGHWQGEALRLQGLAASFGMTDLMEHAARAAASEPGSALLDQVAEALARCR